MQPFKESAYNNNLYAFFEASGWTSKLDNGQVPENLTGFFRNYREELGNFCKLTLETSNNSEMKKIAGIIKEIINEKNTNKLVKILNQVSSEHIKRKVIKENISPELSKEVSNLFIKIVRVESSNELLSSKKANESEKIIKLGKYIDNNIKRIKLNKNKEDKFKKNILILISKILLNQRTDYFFDSVPIKIFFEREDLNKIVIEENGLKNNKLLVAATALEAILDCFEKTDLDDTSLFFEILNTPQGEERFFKMLDQLTYDQLSDAFEGLVRIHKLKTHHWKILPSTKYWDFGFIERFKVQYLTDRVFEGKFLSRWRENDIATNSEMSGLVSVEDREVGLVINERYLAKLRAVGGKELFLENPNGDRIHIMQFKAADFADKVKVSLNDLECIGKAKLMSNQGVRVYCMPKEPFSNNIELMLSLGILVRRKKEDLLNDLDKDSIPLDMEQSLGKDVLVMYTPSISDKRQKWQEGDPVSTDTTAIICAGSGVWFGIYKPMISRLLLNGINVVAFSYRGYEYSEGVPTDAALFQDIETVGHYLKEQGIEDNQLLLYASCMGLGPAAKYVEQHPESHLFIDRSFASFSTLSEHMINEGMIASIPNFARPLAGKVASFVMPWLVNFENIKHLRNAEGKIALITAENDEIVGPEKEILRENLLKAHHITTPPEFGHSGNWLRSPEMIKKFEDYLMHAGHARDFEI